MFIDIILAVYLIFAFTKFNKSYQTAQVCNSVNIDVADKSVHGFIDSKEIKARLQKNKLFPLEQPMRYIDTRRIEEMLKESPFVKTAQCYKTQDGHVNISVTQRMPMVRIKANNGDDYYIDDNNCIMPNSNYTSYILVASGTLSKLFAQRYIAPLSRAITNNEMWLNLVEQINVVPGGGIEIVPRVGNHIVYLGHIPDSKNPQKREELINNFVNKKLTRLEKFYKYGLSQAGWNKYSYINLEFDNQIICKKRNTNIL